MDLIAKSAISSKNQDEAAAMWISSECQFFANGVFSMRRSVQNDTRNFRTFKIPFCTKNQNVLTDSKTISRTQLKGDLHCIFQI